VSRRKDGVGEEGEESNVLAARQKAKWKMEKKLICIPLGLIAASAITLVLAMCFAYVFFDIRLAAHQADAVMFTAWVGIAFAVTTALVATYPN